jgi:glycosyltransferase involved in cell wall biosynthesis|tara:strand:- start:3348 stop:4568 length:1221 start_codon:yes stop_codon:yes gene_type:complete
MIKDKDIIVIGIQAWDIEIGSNCKNIAAEFAKYNRVIYVNNPLSFLDFFKTKKSERIEKRKRIVFGKENGLRKVSNNLWEFNPKTVFAPTNRIKQNYLFDRLTRYNAKKLSNEILRALNLLEFKDYILFNDSSMFLGNQIKTLLNPSSFIYYIRDNLVNSPFPFWNLHGKRYEAQLIKNADVVVTNSIYYTEYACNFNPNSYMVGQGCDVSLFDFKLRKIIPAEELTLIKRPIIGYVGYLASIRLDIDLLEFLAQSRPDWSIVLVGPEDSAFTNSNLHSYDNIHFLGAKEGRKLPEYIKGFDVCINPQLLNETTKGNYPRKIDEYLAMGKPVVATKTIAMGYFKDWVFLAETREDYLSLIEQAFNESSTILENSRREYALTHSWENNVKNISQALTTVKIKNYTKC